MLEFTAALVLLGFLVVIGSQGLWVSYLMGTKVEALARPAGIIGGIVYLSHLAELTPPTGVAIGVNTITFTTTTGWGTSAKSVTFNLGLQGTDLIVTDSAGNSKYLAGGVIGVNGTLDGRTLRVEVVGNSWNMVWAFPLRP